LKQIREQRASPSQSNAREGRIGGIVNSSVALKDCLFLGTVVLLSLVLYLKNLGFYSDDWHFIGLLSNASDQSLFGLVESVFPDTRLRPVQTLYVAGLYWLFGSDPIGYHMVNASVFTLMIALFYLSLNELIRVRLLMVTLPLVYSLLPHYSTDRFWYIAFVANLSIASYFLSLYSDLRALRAQRKALLGWRLLSICGLLCSGLSYEVTVPLFLLNPVLTWGRARRIHTSLSTTELILKVVRVPLLVNVTVIALMAAYKILITRSVTSGFVHNLTVYGEYGSHILRVAIGAIGINFGSYGIGLPLMAWRALRLYTDPTILAVGLVIGMLVFAYLYRTGWPRGVFFSTEVAYFRLMALGIVVLVLGYAIFLTNSQVGFTTTGIKNRTAIASAIGVAVSFVATIGWISWLLPTLRLRRTSFSLMISLLCVGGFLLNNAIAMFWTDASHQQKAVIDAVRREFPVLAPDTTLILDGVCPYAGPGIVFECYWDVGGMLKTYYHDTTLQGDIVKRNIRIEEEGLYTFIYGDQKLYPYGEKLVLFHLGQNRVYQLKDVDSARRYFQVLHPDYETRCAEGSEGYGTEIF
jgi:hypothetical protein